MPAKAKLLCAALLFTALTCSAQQAQKLTVDWASPASISKLTPTLQVVVNPMLERGAKVHNASFAALKALGADYVRYVPWLPYPRLAVAELEPPTHTQTSWDFSRIDPMMDDFMQANAGHSVIINFSTIPAWMFKTKTPVTYPANPNQVDWNYTQGTELRDPSMKEVADYYARLLSWYTRGGFIDELGKYHASGHHYHIAYWELLNEIDFEHHWTPQQYTRFYDTVSAAMLRVDPKLKFVALALAEPGDAPAMFQYFLNPAHHSGGAPLDFISYHFYATPVAGETPQDWQYTFFDQEAGFLNTVRYVEALRRQYSPGTRTDLDELGVILPEDGEENGKPGYIGKPAPAIYWNTAGALYADLYIQLARMGIDVAGESQLVGYHSQFPSVSMMDIDKAEPNARFRVLQLLHSHFGPGNKLYAMQGGGDNLTVQAFGTPHGRSILIVNKRLATAQIVLPASFHAAKIEYVAPSTGDSAPVEKPVASQSFTLEPNEVAVFSETASPER